MTSVMVPLSSRKYPDLFATIDAEDAPIVVQYAWHPMKRKDGTFYARAAGSVLMHRIVMEAALGRALLPSEHVHHREGTLDNRKIHLRVMDAPDHVRLHREGADVLRGRWTMKYPACVVCGTTEGRHAGRGHCEHCYNVHLRPKKGTPRAPTLASKGKWARRFPCCVECGTKEVPHAARGLCDRCYQRR